jgi:hypothetical protein
MAHIYLSFSYLLAIRVQDMYVYVCMTSFGYFEIFYCLFIQAIHTH